MVGKALFFISLALCASMSSAFLGGLRNGLLGNTIESLQDTLRTAVDEVQKVAEPLIGDKGILGGTVNKAQKLIDNAVNDVQKISPPLLGGGKSTKESSTNSGSESGILGGTVEGLKNTVVAIIEDVEKLLPEIAGNNGILDETVEKVKQLLTKAIEDLQKLAPEILGNGKEPKTQSGSEQYTTSASLTTAAGEYKTTGTTEGYGHEATTTGSNGILGETVNGVKDTISGVLKDVKNLLPKIAGDKGILGKTVTDLEKLLRKAVGDIQNLSPEVLGKPKA